jgi:toxin FitB
VNLVDTSGWIEYFFDGPNAAYFTPPIEATEDLVVPTICLYEVFKKINVAGSEAQALQAIAQMKQGRILDLTEDIALSAALISSKQKLPMADSMIFATALAHGAILWTQDLHFASLPGVKYKKAR